MPTGWEDHNGPQDPPGGMGGVSGNPNARHEDFSQYDQPLWQRNGNPHPVETPRFGKRFAEAADADNYLDRQNSQWQGRSVGLEGQAPIQNPLNKRNVSEAEQGQSAPQETQQDTRWKNRSVSRPEDQQRQQPSEPRQQALPYYPPADFTGNRHGTVDSDAEAVQPATPH